MKSKDWIYVSIIGLGVFLIARKAESPLIENPDGDLTNADLGINITTDELRVMLYADSMMYEGQRQGIAPEIIAGVMRAESSGIPTAKRYESNVDDWSYGLMQMLTHTAGWMKELNDNLQYTKGTDLFIPTISIEIGTYYLKRNLNIYQVAPKKNPITDMIASYIAGTVRLNTARQYTNSKGDTVVQEYVDRVIGYKARFRLMFQYLYPFYSNQFPSNIWGS